MKNSPDTMPKSEICFYTDKQIRQMTNLSEKTWRSMVPQWERRGFPKKQKGCGDKRFWPAVQDFLLKEFGKRATIHASGEFGKENFS